MTRTALAAAKDAGVHAFLLISNVYPYGRARTATVAETHPREPQTRKGQYRKEQADLVLAAHDPAGLRTASLVLPDFYGPTAELSYANEIFAGATTGRTANVLGPLDVPREYVYVPDVGPVVADLFERPAAFGRPYNFGGPGTITTHDFIAAAEAASGTRIKTLRANKTMLRLLGAFNPLMREIVEMYYLFTDPVVLDDSALRSVLPGLRKTPYAQGIPATIAALRGERAATEAVHGAA
jgi:nucleoside-diphosphate-sugar epimerase